MPISRPTFRRDKCGEVWQFSEMGNSCQTEVTIRDSDGARIVQRLMGSFEVHEQGLNTRLVSRDGSCVALFETGSLVSVKEIPATNT
jgi:hypothetical protein